MTMECIFEDLEMELSLNCNNIRYITTAFIATSVLDILLDVFSHLADSPLVRKWPSKGYYYLAEISGSGGLRCRGSVLNDATNERVR